MSQDPPPPAVPQARAQRDDAFVAWQQLWAVYGPDGAHVPDAAKRWLDAYLRWEAATDAALASRGPQTDA